VTAEVAAEAAPLTPPPAPGGAGSTPFQESPSAAIPAPWAPDAEKELRKIPFFVRGKARRNTERYALERSVSVITVETLYDAKAHFSR
jgi:light-independent protochlorophyllide reductase subunit B